MTGDWKEFLQQQGAVYDDAGAKDFGNPAAELKAADSGIALVDLSYLSLIRVSGADAKSFLNGQLTNDLSLLDGNRTQISAWCNPKGRMLAIFRIIRHGDAYLLQLPTLLRDDIAKRLRMYVLRSKVIVENADDMFVRMGIVGPEATERLNATLGPAPQTENAYVQLNDAILLRLPGLHPRFEVLAAPATAPSVWTALKKNAMPAGRNAWTWHDIMAGLPEVLPETSDAFVPQMANLDLIGGISFNKGCYTGQEIVARVHYLGRLKQRMYRAHVDVAETPKPGTHIYTQDRQDQTAGTIVTASPAPSGGCDLLVVTYIENTKAAELHLGSPSGPQLRLDPLPYAIPS